MTFEADTPPPFDTFRRFVWSTVQYLQYLRAYWGRRMVGGAYGLFADMLSEAATQGFYARLPGHAHQADDSIRQVGLDRDIHRFRGESVAAFKQRVRDAWDDYQQGASDIQLLKVVNQWGQAGWPVTWGTDPITLVESADPAVFEFELTIPFGNIEPPWIPWVLGDGHVLGENGLYLGVGPSTDIPMLLWLVRKWKPSRSRGLITVFYSVSESVTFKV